MVEEGKTALDQVLQWIGLSGLLSLAGLVFFGGRLAQRVDEVENLKDLPVALARMEERLKSMQTDIAELKQRNV